MNKPHSLSLKTSLPFPAACVLVFLLPWLVKLLFGLPWLMLQNFTDGVFYLGYAMHFRELLDRVGLTYYAVRFSGIAPDALAFSVFGAEVGFVVVRYALAGGVLRGAFLFSSRCATGWRWDGSLRSLGHSIRRRFAFCRRRMWMSSGRRFCALGFV